MKRFKLETVQHEVYDGATCDGCGSDEPYLVEVVISVNEGEEGGRRDEYDFCDDCVMERVDVLIAAGSRAPYLTGMDLPNNDEENE